MNSVLIDTNIGLLLLAGMTDPKIISRHKRLNTFDVQDYELLISYLNQFDQIIFTPHVFTEISNLATKTLDPDKTYLLATLGQLMEQSTERYIKSSLANALPNKLFQRLGVADSVNLMAISGDETLLTDDALQYYTALEMGKNVVNFNTVRELSRTDFRQ